MSDAKRSPGQLLHALWATCFNGGGWVDEAPRWEDYDEAGRAAWEANAKQIARNIGLSLAASDLLEALRELVLYHDVPAEVQDPVVKPLLAASFAAISRAEGRSA